MNRDRKQGFERDCEKLTRKDKKSSRSINV